MNAATHQQPAPTQCAQSREVLPTAQSYAVALGYSELTGPMAARVELGAKNYGKPLMTFNGRNAGTDAYQELLDAVLYAAQADMEGRGSLAVRTQRRKALEAQMHAAEQQRILLAMIEKEQVP